MASDTPPKQSTFPSASFNPEGVQIIEFGMMDKFKYYPLAALSGFTVRTILYPMTLIRTRLQIQKHKAMYTGTWDAYRTITKQSGIRGLYDGFLVYNLSLVSQMTYIITYERMRQKLIHDGYMNIFSAGFIAGGCASIAAQLFQVPIDIVNQHLQMREVKVKSANTVTSGATPTNKPPFGKAAASIVKKIYAENGPVGFYRGFGTSVFVYAPNSACWWTLYPFYTGLFSSVLPTWFPRLAIQCLAAVAGGMTITFFSNPLDVIRARVQVNNSRFWPESKRLWKEEGISGMFKKGVTARMVQSCSFSFLVICGYETVKRASLLPEYKDHVRW